MTTTHAFTIFDTAIGACGIAWNEYGIAGVQLPERSESRLRARLGRHFPDAALAAPPADVQKAIDAIVALLAGKSSDLSFVSLDMTHVPDFHRRVYDVARRIQPGSTMSYGEIATQLGTPRDARAVGQALGQNPFPIVVPCHRVVAAGGKLGGFSAPGGVTTKLRLLAIEGAPHQLRMDITAGENE
jgi:methylated-DNA-[protein]-cysteine S-methyltransferase